MNGVNSLTEKNAVAVAFVRTLEQILKKHSLQQLHEAQFSNHRYLGITDLLRAVAVDSSDSCQSVSEKPKHCPKSEKATKKQVTFGDQFDDLEIANYSVSTLQVNNSEPFVVIFDESDGLLGGLDVSDELCPLRCLQRALNDSDIIGVFLSKSSRLGLEQREGSSFRTFFRQSYRPFLEIIAHDIFQNHVFLLGRPLWFKHWLYYYGRDFNKLVSYVVAMLRGKFR